MAFPPGFLDELRGRISLSGLVGRRVKLIRRGREFAGLCPFHHEKTPSFYVVEDKSFFHCFGCGAHGDAIGFVMRADNLDFIEAVEKLAGGAGHGQSRRRPRRNGSGRSGKKPCSRRWKRRRFLRSPALGAGGQPGAQISGGRGLDPETIRRFRLGFAPDERLALRRGLATDFTDALLIEAGLLRRAEDARAIRLFPRPYDLSDRRPHRPGNRLWRPGDG